MPDWRDIPGYEGYYQASDAGEVRSVDRVIDTGLGWTAHKSGRVLAQKTDRHGYRAVVLSRDGAHRTMFVHRAVMLAFVGEPGSGEVCMHLDGCNSHNERSNLSWGSISENQLDRYRHARMRLTS